MIIIIILFLDCEEGPSGSQPAGEDSRDPIRHPPPHPIIMII